MRRNRRHTRVATTSQLRLRPEPYLACAWASLASFEVFFTADANLDQPGHGIRAVGVDVAATKLRGARVCARIELEQLFLAAGHELVEPTHFGRGDQAELVCVLRLVDPRLRGFVQALVVDGDELVVSLEYRRNRGVAEVVHERQVHVADAGRRGDVPLRDFQL